MDQNSQNQPDREKARYEGYLKEAKRDRLVGYAKAISGTVLPLAAAGGLAVGSGYVLIENDLAHLIHLVSVGFGAVAALPWAVITGSAILEDIPWASRDIKMYRSHLESLDQIVL